MICAATAYRPSAGADSWPPRTRTTTCAATGRDSRRCYARSAAWKSAGVSRGRRSVGVFVFAPGGGIRRLVRRCAIEQERVVRGDERIGCRHRIGVVHGPVVAREGDVAGILTQSILELGSDLSGP